MDDYAGRVLADRYRLPLPPSDEYEFAESRAFDTYSGQEVLVRQVPLPETVDAEVLDEDTGPYGTATTPYASSGRSTRRPADPAVRRAIEAAQAAAQIPDHPRLDQVFDVFAEGGSLWIVSEVVAALPLAALIADRPLSPYRAAEVASDVLTALRVLHAHGWVHRNITVRTVLVCDDGRIMLTGLAAGAAEEALCGYDPVPERVPDVDVDADLAPDLKAAPGTTASGTAALRTAELGTADYGTAASGTMAPRTAVPRTAPRAGAIAAYRAGARAAASRAGEGLGPATLPGPRSGGESGSRGGDSRGAESLDSTVGAGDSGPPGRIADPYGVAGRPEARAGGVPAPQPSTWDELVAPEPSRKGPATPLAAERARQARMNIVGAVTERWSPEQAGPVHENWQLAAPVGHATDLWALGALLFRAVQGHAPYPEESAYELVQLVCAEPPAFAEECGPLRPVVESLLRQDPTERPDFEELRGWLRSLVRSAPEPEAGLNVVPAPPFDRTKLPVVRRRGELVRRRRAGRHKKGRAQGRARGAAPYPSHLGHGEEPPALGPGPARAPRVRAERAVHGQSAPPAQRAPKGQRAPRPSRGPRPDRVPRPPRALRDQESPHRLGRVLLVVVLLGLVAAVAYAVLFMPKAGDGGSEAAGDRAGQVGPGSSAPADPSGGAEDGKGAPGDGNKESPTSQRPDEEDGGAKVAEGFALRTDAEGFRVAVAEGWERRGGTGRGQVAYAGGAFELIVVPGRDRATGKSSDPLYYQRERESELQPFRDSSWATSTGMRRIDVGGRVRAEGQFTWQDADGDEVYVRNTALLIDGRYHVVLVRGPESERDEVTRLHEQAVASYRPGKR